jgi:hypothetical protein
MCNKCGCQTPWRGTSPDLRKGIQYQLEQDILEWIEAVEALRRSGRIYKTSSGLYKVKKETQ